jgi:hypothetical protein
MKTLGRPSPTLLRHSLSSFRGCPLIDGAPMLFHLNDWLLARSRGCYIRSQSPIGQTLTPRQHHREACRGTRYHGSSRIDKKGPSILKRILRKVSRAGKINGTPSERIQLRMHFDGARPIKSVGCRTDGQSQGDRYGSAESRNGQRCKLMRNSKAELTHLSQSSDD